MVYLIVIIIKVYTRDLNGNQKTLSGDHDVQVQGT